MLSTYTNWLKKENSDIYRPEIDGPPLKPKTIAGAEQQIRHLAYEIRGTFGSDPRLQAYKWQIQQATEMLERAASIIGNVMSGEERNLP